VCLARHVIASIALFVVAGLVLAPSAGAVSTVSPTPGSLSAYKISAAYVTGVSSGGYMASQLHVAYSGTFKGAGIFAAGPYYCAHDSLIQALLVALHGCVQSSSNIQLTFVNDANLNHYADRRHPLRRGPRVI
jgi:hypothetical protein